VSACATSRPASGITEGAAHNIVCELEAAGDLTRHTVGARNVDELHPELPLRPPAQSGLSIGDPLRVLLEHACNAPAT
jgi:hypothetical protein